MRFSENRLIAWIVFAVIIVFSICVSGGSALRDLSGATERIFYNGAAGDGLCINRDLTVRAESAANMVSTAQSARSVRQELIGAVSSDAQALSEAETISDKYEANANLTQSVEQLYNALSSAGISESDMTYVTKQYNEFNSRAHTISLDPYNERAREFNDTLSGFPASFVARLCGVKALDLFA